MDKSYTGGQAFDSGDDMINNKRMVVVAALVLLAVGAGVFLTNPSEGEAVNANASDTQPVTLASIEEDALSLEPINVSDTSAENPLGEVVLGREDAPVTMIEYASLTCSHCGAFHNEKLPILKEEYIDTGKVKIFFRPFPFDGLATAGAMLVYCVAPEQRMNFLSILYKRQSAWLMSEQPLAELEKIARYAGLSETDFRVCLKDESIFNGIREIQKAAQEKAEVRSTPTFFINGEKIEGNADLALFRQVLDKHVANQ